RMSLGLVDHRANLVLRDAELEADLDMVRILVRRARQVAALQAREFARAAGELAAEADIAAQPMEGAGGGGAVGEDTVQRDVPRQQVLVLRREVGLGYLKRAIGAPCQTAMNLSAAGRIRAPGRPAWRRHRRPAS